MSDLQSSEGSVTKWIRQLEAGDPAAAAPLLKHFTERLVRLAQSKLRNARRRVADEEDIVSEVFTNFLEAVETGVPPVFADRDDLWKWLCMVSERRVIDQLRRETADKRGAGKVRGDSAVDESDAEGICGFDQFADAEPTPEMAASLIEETENLFKKIDQLPRADEWQLRRLAIMKLEGFTNQEIADELNIGLATIGRRLKLIRDAHDEGEES